MLVVAIIIITIIIIIIISRRIRVPSSPAGWPLLNPSLEVSPKSLTHSFALLCVAYTEQTHIDKCFLSEHAGALEGGHSVTRCPG